MKDVLLLEISKNSKKLIVFATSLQGDPIPSYLEKVITDAFEPLTPYIKDERQVVYIRDIETLAIDGKYPGGNCYHRYEAFFAVPSWDPDKLNKQQFAASINHELHHLARWQNAGYGNTLGGAILSEGLATFYEEKMSGWTPPWSQVELSEAMVSNVLSEWDNEQYDHKDWFFNGKLGRWVGYSIGYNAAKELYKGGFNLGDSLEVKPEQIKDIVRSLPKD